MNPTEKHDELHWQAFAYWSGDLSPVDRLQFEQRLAVDQVAREALAEVVELSQAVAAAESLAGLPAHVPPGRRSIHRTWGWIAAVAATVLAMVLGFELGRQDGANEWLPGIQTRGPRANAELAAAWTETRSQWAELTESQVAISPETSLSASPPPVETLSSLTEWDHSPMETPSWMAAGVVGQMSDADPEDVQPADSASDAASTES